MEGNAKRGVGSLVKKEKKRTGQTGRMQGYIPISWKIEGQKTNDIECEEKVRRVSHTTMSLSPNLQNLRACIAAWYDPSLHGRHQ